MAADQLDRDDQSDHRCQITEFALPAGNQPLWRSPWLADGNLWFTSIQGDTIGLINPTTNAISEFAIPTPRPPHPEGIAAGSDGNLWFPEYTANQIGKISPTTGAIAEYPPSLSGALPRIAAGPDGNLWFPTYSGGDIGKIDPTTDAVAEYTVPYALHSNHSGSRRAPTATSGTLTTSTNAIGEVRHHLDSNWWVPEQPPASVTAVKPLSA